jgi:type VI protein secretion system component VasK
MRNSLFDRIIDGPFGRPLIWLLMIAFAVLALLAWPLLKLWEIRRWLREWKQAIADVDAGGDSNDASK